MGGGIASGICKENLGIVVECHYCLFAEGCSKVLVANGVVGL